MEADISRSEEMVLYQLFLQPEAAYGTLAELGDMGCAQFRDVIEFDPLYLFLSVEHTKAIVFFFFCFCVFGIEILHKIFPVK